MKKTILQRFFLSLCLMIVGCLWGSAAWAETITLSQTTIGSLLGTSSYKSSDFTYSGITWGRTKVYSSKEGIQIDGGTSKALWNKTEIPGAITKIIVTQKINSSTLTVGTTASPATNTKTNAANKTTTYEFSASDNYRYFKIAATSKYSVVTSIEITYEAAGSPTFSLASGTYYGNQTLELSSTVDRGTIYYTTDGTDPSESGTATEYTTPINLTAPSTLTIKAIVMDSEYNFSSVVSHTYNILTSIANTQETALTTAEAISLIDATTAEQLAAEKVYVKGTISKVDSYNSTNKSITYWLDDNKFEVYSGRGLDNTDFSAKTDIEVGAEVIIYGNITKYKTTYEFDKNNYLVSYYVAAKTLESVTISGTPTQTTYEVGEAFNTAGLTVTAYYSDGSSKEITSGITWNVTPETLTADITSVTVTATVDEVTSEAFTVNGITVRALQSVTLEGTPTKTSYSVGETFDPTGIIVKANYSTGVSEDVTSEATFNYNNSALTSSTTSMAVTATYGGMTSAEQNYTITVLKTIVPFAPKVIYRKITSTADIVDGGVYLIVCETKGKAMSSIDPEASKYRCQSVSATLTDHTYVGEVNKEGKPYEITIKKASNGTYYLYHEEGKYINGTGGTDLYFQETGKAGWSFTFVASTGNVKIGNTSNKDNYIQHNGTDNNNYFKNYASGQSTVQLYQKVGEISVAKATGGITTFASNYDYIMPEHLTGYIVTAAEEAGTMTTKVAYVAGKEVPAYTPLIIKSNEEYAEESSKTYTPVALNKSLIYTDEANMLEYKRNASGYTETSKSESVYYYKLAIKDGNVGFYWGADEGAAFQMTKPSTAYLTVPKTMSVQGFVLNLEEGETTGIATVVTNEDAPIYNLQGIRMNGKNLPKGIYIQGGKKFMVK